MIKLYEEYKHLLPIKINAYNLNNINYYVERGWYLQLAKEYGIVFVLLHLEYFTKNEDYLECQKILEIIEDSNKHFGTNYPVNIKDYGKMREIS